MRLCNASRNLRIKKYAQLTAHTAQICDVHRTWIIYIMKVAFAEFSWKSELWINCAILVRDFHQPNAKKLLPTIISIYRSGGIYALWIVSKVLTLFKKIFCPIALSSCCNRLSFFYMFMSNFEAWFVTHEMR